MRQDSENAGQRELARNEILLHKTTHIRKTKGHVIFSWHLGESMPWPHVWASETRNGGWRGVVRKSESGMKGTIAT